MAAAVGPLLQEVFARLQHESVTHGFLAVASDRARLGVTPETIAVTALLPHRPPEPGEPWSKYEAGVTKRLRPWSRRLAKMDVEVELMIASTGLQFRAAPDQLLFIREEADDVEFIELDPLLVATVMDDVPSDVDLPAFRTAHPGVDGRGVTVAVVDTGVDLEHPYLSVAESVSTCPEPVELPGLHGTHCAGILASQDAEFAGIAPGVRVLNVKAGRADNRFAPGDVSRALGWASARDDVDIISASLGFNHLPQFSPGGHGWRCTRRMMCQLCRAVETASRRGKLVTVAAGNEHNRAEALRRAGDGGQFDTELCCPGQSVNAFTVGSVTKGSWLPASASSRGPSSSGARKPDIAAPGVNVTSTLPGPRDARNRPRSRPPRAELFGRQSGTSMATPIVAGLAALVIQRDREGGGKEPTAARVRSELIRGAEPLPFGPDVVGAGLVRAP